MKVTVDNQDLFTLSDFQKKVIQNDIPSEIFDADMKRRLQYILEHKYERCMERLRTEWEPKLKAAGAPSIPTDDQTFAQLVFARHDYKDRSERDADPRVVTQPLVPA
ncbi:MAG: hypothetical protein AAB875_06790, partial [Patescibacteria group bacterium]